MKKGARETGYQTNRVTQQKKTFSHKIHNFAKKEIDKRKKQKKFKKPQGWSDANDHKLQQQKEGGYR